MKWVLPLAVVLSAAVLVWLTFYPAIMSADSLDQYRQALAGVYNDWHPPIMSITLAGFLRLGTGLGGLMFLQCVLGLTGLWLFVVLLQRSFVATSSTVGTWMATIGVLILLLPITPLAFYLMSFWKDAWLAFVVLWIGALAVALHEASPAARGRLRVGTVILCLLMALAVMVRHNAVLLVPAFCTLLFIIHHRRRIGPRLGLALIPVVLILAEPVLNRGFHVQVARPTVHVKALDLVGLCVLDPALRDTLPFTSQNLIDDLYQKYYVFGYTGPVCWEQPAIVKPTYLSNETELTREYWHAVRTCPTALAAVKLRAFLPLLGLRETSYWFHNHLTDNPYDLRWGTCLAGPRAAFIAAAERVGHTPWRWIFGVHLVWLVLAVAGSVVTWGLYVRRRASRFRLYGVLFLIPLLYYTSFMLVSTGHDFRFLYPATLYVQVLVAAGGVAMLARLVARGRASPPKAS